MEGWQKNTIEELSSALINSVVDGPFGSNLKVSDYVESGIPVLQGYNITGNKFKFDNVRYISHSKAKSLYRSNVMVGDLLSVKIGSVGYSAIVDNLDKHSFAIIPANLLRSRFDNNIISNKYVYYFLVSQRGRDSILNLVSNTAQPAISLKGFKSIQIEYPKSLFEQSEIIEILDTVEDTISKTQNLISKYQRIKTGLMQDLLTKGIDEKGNIRSKETHRFVVKNGIEVPEEWEVITFENACDLITDFTANGSFESLRVNVKYHYKPNFARLIRLFDLRQNLQNEGVYVNEIGYNFLKKSSLEAGDILLANVGEYTGYTCLMPDVSYKTTIAPNMFLIRVNKDYNNKFLLNYMSSRRFQNQINRNNLSSTTKLLNKTNLRKFFIVKPNIEEQNKISLIFKTLDDSLNVELRNLNKLNLIKTGLMQDLLTGKVKVKAKEEENVSQN